MTSAITKKEADLRVKDLKERLWKVDIRILRYWDIRILAAIPI